jgi:hypothetical protein
MTTDSMTPRAEAAGAFAWRLLLRPFVWAALAIPPLALGVELFTHACMNLLIDPIPTWAHVALVALVPVATFRATFALARGRGTHVRVDSALLATACGASFAYCVGLFPILAMACMATLYLPLLMFLMIGELGSLGDESSTLFRMMLLVPLALAPLVALVSTVAYHWRLGRRFPGARRRFGAFFALGLGLFALAEIPGIAAHYGLSHGVRESHALFALRNFATREAMLRAVRFGPHNAHVLGWASTGALSGINEHAAPERYFRTTGDALHGAPAVELTGASTPAGSWLDEMRFDPMQGGDRVGRGLGDVTWTGSEIDGELHAEGEFAYLEWTLTFRNDGARPREARARVALPAGAVVSRTTLWVDGVEREGSVGTRAATRAAYEKVVQARRDPLLVTAKAIDEVLVQCFPIPPKGGEMKIRLGITAPLLPYGSDALALSLPHFVEQNFGEAGLEPNVTLRSPSGDVTLAEGGARVARTATPASIWVADARGAPPMAVQQTFREGSSTRGLLVVVDGSQSVARHLPEIIAGLEDLARESPLEILLAADEPAWLGDDPDALERVSFQGGQEAAAALLLAVERMRERTETGEPPSILWIHGPRPVALAGSGTLEQELMQSDPGPIFHFALEPGPNRLWSRLELHVEPGGRARAGLHTVARVERVSDDLRAFGAALRSGDALRTVVRERGQPGARAAASVREPTSRAAVHLTRLWAWDESRRRGRPSPSSAPEAAEALANAVAARYELVTPWSGAVVLETDAEYTAASLPIPRREPDDPTLGDPPDGPFRAEWADAPDLSPPIPEPTGALLFALGGGILAVARRLRK